VRRYQFVLLLLGGLCVYHSIVNFHAGRLGWAAALAFCAGGCFAVFYVSVLLHRND